MYTRYSPGEDLTGFDFIVVGSGIGGLTTAIFLSKAGKKVLVLESHYVPGGFSQTFKRRSGFVWDVGVHYVGNMDKEKSFLRKIFNYLTDGKLNWEFMGDIYDVVNIGGDQFSFVAGKDKLREKLIGEFPGEKRAIEIYFNKIGRAARYSAMFFVQKSFPWILEKTLGKIFELLFNRYASKTTQQVIRSITQNEKLAGILCSQCGNYGLPPGESSFAAHAIVINHFLNGGYYPVGGSQEIYKTLLDTLFKHKGEIRIKAKVDEIVLKKGKVDGVRLGNQFIPCKNVISNAGINNTFQNLIPGSRNETTSVKVHQSTAHLCLYLGLDQSDAELKLPRHNIWFYKNYDFDALKKSLEFNTDRDLEFAYISFPSSKDPSWSARHPSKATIQAIGPAKYEWFKKFENNNWMKRGAEYEALKAEFRNKMLKRLYQLVPQIRGHVVHAEVSSPLSTRHFTNYAQGEIYGLEHSPARFKLKSLKPKSSIQGLYLAGQDIVTVGVGGALASGLLCATQILKFGMARQFRAIAASS